MSDLNEQRNFFEKEAEVGNSQLRRSVGEVTTSVSNLSKEVTKKGGLADSMVSAAAKAQDLTNKFFSQYDALQNLINQYSKAADGANEFYQKMVDLINVQIAYNHAKNGATSVSWGPGGVHANYSNNFGGGGSDSGGGSNNGGFDDNSGDSDEPKRVVGFSPIDNDYHLVKWSDGTSEKRSHMTSRGSNKCIHCGYVKKYGYKKLRSSGKGTVEIMNLSTGQSFWVNDTQANKAKYGYKTGGYTGSWNGPNVEENGKLAFLHQKELVLNATDTENMLEAVKLIRQISQQIDLQAISQSSGFSAVATQFFSDREPLQQDITIHAEFPNATDHNEIEQAFDNLANKAAQFANRY